MTVETDRPDGAADLDAHLAARLARLTETYKKARFEPSSVEPLVVLELLRIAETADAMRLHAAALDRSAAAVERSAAAVERLADAVERVTTLAVKAIEEDLKDRTRGARP